MTDLICAMVLSWSVRASLTSLLLLCSLLLTSFPYTTSATTPIISNLTDDDANWAIAVRKGTTYFHYMETGCYPDESTPLDMDDLKRMGWQLRWPPQNGSSLIDDDIYKKFGWRNPEEGTFCSTEARRDCEFLFPLLPLLSAKSQYDVIILWFDSRLPPRRSLFALMKSCSRHLSRLY